MTVRSNKDEAEDEAEDEAVDKQTRRETKEKDPAYRTKEWYRHIDERRCFGSISYTHTHAHTQTYIYIARKEWEGIG